MRQPRLILLHVDPARMHNESEPHILFPLSLATRNTNFHSYMAIIHPVLFRAWLCVEGWYTVVGKKSLHCTGLLDSSPLKVEGLCSLLV